MTDRKTCEGCRNGAKFAADITMAFQPILDVRNKRMFAYEALLRGAEGEGAGVILSQVTDANRYAFDQKCRVTAIELATALDLAEHDAYLSINFLPNAVYEPKACIKLTLETVARKIEWRGAQNRMAPMPGSLRVRSDPHAPSHRTPSQSPG